jgi:hypothetical protein
MKALLVILQLAVLPGAAERAIAFPSTAPSRPGRTSAAPASGTGAATVLDVKDFGAACDGKTDDVRAINGAIARAAAVGATVLISGPVRVSSEIVMASGVHVIASGRIVAGSQRTIVSFGGVSDATWDGGEVIGDGATDDQSGFVLTNALRNTLRGFSVSDARNKGFDLTGDSHDNQVFPRTISGSTGTFGAGLSMYGAAVTRNTVYAGEFTKNRVGITLNGGSYNSVIGANASGNMIAGLMLDGVVSNSGDGAKHCEVIGGTFDRNSDDAAPKHYGGVYLGNGASYNRIVGIFARGNAGAGIRSSATYRVNDLIGNSIEGPTVERNAGGGIVLSGASKTRIVTPIVRSNTGHGISLFHSDDCSIAGGESADNTGAGVHVQAERSRVEGTRVHGNDTGYSVQPGGSSRANGNVLTGADVSANRLNYNIAPGLARIAVPGGAPLPYSTSIDWDASRSDVFTLTPSDGSAYALRPPSHATVGETVSIRVVNARGAPLGTMTWPSNFKMVRWTQPAPGRSRTLTLIYDGTSWREVCRTPDDAPEPLTD